MGKKASLSPGSLVHVRQRNYLVDEVVKPPAKGDATLVRLSCIDDDAQGQPLDVLWEHEIDARILDSGAWDEVSSRGFDPPNLFSAYIHTMRWNCVTATNPRLFQSPFRAGIRIDAYQLEPLRKALRLPRVNLFIADDVGLGKTIEAGLIARELLLRKRVRDIVVACPPSMIAQWQDEMEARFGLIFEVLDRNLVGRVRRERGYGVNPWTTHTRFIISHRLLIDPDYTLPMQDWLGALRPGSLLILDEAHHAAPASGSRYAIDSQITQAVRDLAHRFEHRLFLSATPHNGHSNSFSALLELLDPQRFCRGVKVPASSLAHVMVRRLKDDIREIAGGFPKRIVQQIDIDGLPADAAELKLAEHLDRYRTLREERLKTATKRQQASAGLLTVGLQQRLLSSVEAFARTLAVHRKTVRKEWERILAGERAQADDDRPNLQTALALVAGPRTSDDDRAEVSEDDYQREEDLQVEEASRSALPRTVEASRDPRFAEELDLLERMTSIAEHGRGEADAKVRAIIAWIREHQCRGAIIPGEGAPKPGSRWSDERVIIFTEWDDTKRYLLAQLEAAIEGTDRADERILVFHGPTPPDKREAIKRAFNAPPGRQPVRILLATDAAREGINLQTHCSTIFHFDVPWNPSRMEQRNGRIDRKLQPSPEVHCNYFVYRQRPEDRVLQTLVAKTERIKKELGSLSPVLETRLADALKYGIRRRDVGTTITAIEGTDLDAEKKLALEQELEETRERREKLGTQIDELRDSIARSRRWIGLDEDHFRGAISASLAMMGAEPLYPAPANGDASGGPVRWTFPELDRRRGADPTWAPVLDTLRPPRPKEQPPWEWRRTAKIRPVIFEDPGTLDEEVVHLHLEHRMVRRLLNRFTAQGFLLHDLSRACLASTGDAIPRVLLIGRLALFGPGAARLHEEMVPITARWVEPARRSAALKPYSREAESQTLDLLEQALDPSRTHGIPEKIRKDLQTAATRDITDLLPHLESRGAEIAEDTAVKLRERGRIESREMHKILEEQKKRLQATAGRYEDPQLSLDFDQDEQRQLASNRRHWAKRLTEIDRELETEPGRIRAQYEIQATRLEPVGLVYLWPVTG